MIFFMGSLPCSCAKGHPSVFKQVLSGMSNPERHPPKPIDSPLPRQLLGSQPIVVQALLKN
jgi:hypothetical protein